MIRHIVNFLYHRYNRCLVNAESQKVVCQVQGRTYTLSYPLVAFQSGKMFKRLGGVV